MQNGAKTASSASATAPKRKACGSARSTNSRNMRSSPFISGCCSFSLRPTRECCSRRTESTLGNQGFAIVNALIFGKVVLIAQALNLVRNLKDSRPWIWVVLRKVAPFHRRSDPVPAYRRGSDPGPGPRACCWLPLHQRDFGGGTWLGLADLCGDLLHVALIPFFAFQEVAEVVGSNALWDLFFTRDRKMLKLVRD